jgi:hypothetical protein
MGKGSTAQDFKKVTILQKKHLYSQHVENIEKTAVLDLLSAIAVIWGFTTCSL